MCGKFNFDLIWLSWQINKDSKHKGHESSIGEILDTCKYSKQKQTDSVMCGKVILI